MSDGRSRAAETFVPRQWSRGEVEELAVRHRRWGKWGDEDERGAANFVTDETVARAAQLVRRGTRFSLALPMDRTGPQRGVNGRVNPQHIMLRAGTDILATQRDTPDIGFTDDAAYIPLQSSTQWDAFCHVFYDGRTYNGREPGTVTSQGAEFNSITNLGAQAVGRGVLLDLPRVFGRESLAPGDSIQAEHLEECAREQGVEVGRGDFVLVRTGQMAACRSAGEWGDYAGGPAPGLGLSAAEFLCPREVVAVCTDTWGIEALPYECPEIRAPLHVVLLVNAGVYIGEMWDLEELADDCALDGVYEFMLVAPPLNVTGAVGSPLHPIAIK